jgi:hypothetical protein
MQARRPYISAGLLLAYAAWFAWAGWRSDSLANKIACVVTGLAAAGLLLRWPWARWLAMVCAALAWCAFLLAVVPLYRTGGPYPEPARNVIALIPGALWLASWTAIALGAWRARPGPPPPKAVAEAFD